MKVHLDERRLIKALREQDFIVQETSDGYRVYTATGQSTTFHASSLDAAPGIYQQVISKLVKLGFVEPSELKRRMTLQARKEREARDRAEAEAGPYPCGDCDFTGKYLRGLARHQQSARHGEYKATPIVVENASKKTMVKHEPDELKAKRLVRKLKEQIAAVNKTTDELISLVEPLESQNHQMRAKLKRLEGVVGKLVEEI